MNLFLNSFEELAAAFDALEGDGWWVRSFNRSEWSPGLGLLYSVEGAYGKLEKLMSPDAYQPEPDYVIWEIYGSGGWHRYMVFPSGDVQFSASHARPEKTQLAGELGFTIWE